MVYFIKMEQITSQTGHLQILYCGYSYRKERTLANGISSYRCTVNSCKERVHIDCEHIGERNEHNHVPCPAKTSALFLIIDYFDKLNVVSLIKKKDFMLICLALTCHCAHLSCAQLLALKCPMLNCRFMYLVK